MNRITHLLIYFGGWIYAHINMTTTASRDSLSILEVIEQQRVLYTRYYIAIMGIAALNSGAELDSVGTAHDFRVHILKWDWFEVFRLIEGNQDNEKLKRLSTCN